MFQSYRRAPPEISLSALVDVLFILVVFVMLAANFDKARAIDVSLPEGGQETATPTGAVVVTVRADGSVRVGAVEVPPARLEAHLRALGAARAGAGPGVGPVSMILAAERQVTVERAAEILSMAQRAGFDAVSIATRAPAERAP